MSPSWTTPVRKSLTAGGVIALMLVALAACHDTSATAPASNNELLAAFDSAWQRFDNTYPYFDYKHVDWAALRGRYRPLAAAATTPDALAASVRMLLSELRDVHASMTTPSGAANPTYVPNAFVNWRQPAWDAYLQLAGAVKMPSSWGYASLGSVPYIYFASFADGRFTLAGVDSVLEQFRDAPAIVIDVRMNGGGSSALAFGVAARFYDAPHLTGTVQYRNGPSHSSFGDPVANIVGPRGAWQFTRPVLLLTGRGVFSSAEGFIMAMRVLPHVTVAGDTTGGGSGNPTKFLLPGGWTYNLSRWIERTPSGDVVEWRGLPPAIVVPASASDFDAGRDPVLDFAARWASRYAPAKAPQS